MKKSLILLLTLFFAGLVFSQENIKSDIGIFKDITQSFENKYYPGTIENVELLQNKYPDSVFIQQALVFKAHAFVNLECYDDAIATLTNAISHMHTGQKGFTECHYLLGLSYFYLEDYEKASECFYVSTQLANLDKDDFHYAYSVFFFAESYYNLGRYEEVFPIYEYVIEHGKSYSKDDYSTAVQKLMISYNKCGLYSKTTDLYKALDKSIFSNDEKSIITLYAAEAYEKNKQYDNAYNLYCDVIASDNEELAIIALKNAFNLSDSKKISVNPGNIFAQSTDTFKNDPELVNEFWIRLGIDEYNKKHYEKALTYFENVKENYPIVNIYKAKIILDKDSSPEGGKKAEEILVSIKNINGNKTVKNMTDTYYSLLLQCAVQQEKWETVPSIFGKIKNPDNHAIYINSTYYYRKGDYEKVSPENGVLYASALSRLGKYKEACAVYEKLDADGKINGNQLIEYAKALFLAGQYDYAYDVAQRSTSYDKEYISGLSKFNLGDFSNARNHFISYIKIMSGKEDFNPLAIYYKGYSEYALEEFKNSYATFVRFSSLNQADDKYRYKAHYYAAISALQLGDYHNAAVQAKNVIKTASNEEDKIKATIFTSEILTDSGKYDEAVGILLPYIEKKSQFTVEALFRVAKIYEKQGNPELADKTYTKIYTDYPRTEYAEEAMYRAAEVYYFKEDFSTAYTKFNNYVTKYGWGQFLDGALYFSGDCALKVGEINKSILINKNLVAKFPNSVYAYGAYKNLLDCYYKQEDYSKAFDIASILVNNYSEQAAADKIGSRLIELEKIVKGADRRVVEKQSQFEAAGGVKTKKGRKIGSEIVSLYSENAYTQKYAYELAVQLLEKQTESDEMSYAAENAEFVGDYLRAKEENKKSAEYYLMAAKYYRSIDNSMKAAAVLYSATEAFVGAGLKGDALETANLLKELYPETRYAERVDRIVR